MKKAQKIQDKPEYSQMEFLTKGYEAFAKGKDIKDNQRVVFGKILKRGATTKLRSAK